MTTTHRILRYFKDSPGMGLLFSMSLGFTIIAFSNLDWAGCQETHHSTTGYVVFVGSSLVSWKSKRQTIVKRSLTEAKYQALANESREITWIEHLLKGIDFNNMTLILHSDNSSTVQIAKNPILHVHMKHVELDQHVIRDKILARELKIEKINMLDNLLDNFTKLVPKPVFLRLIK